MSYEFCIVNIVKSHKYLNNNSANTSASYAQSKCLKLQNFKIEGKQEQNKKEDFEGQ